MPSKRNPQESGVSLPPLPEAVPAAPEEGGVEAAASSDDPTTSAITRALALQPVPAGLRFPPFHIRSLRCGCYLVNYKPKAGFFLTYDGTIRVECHSAGRTASGDLYQRPLIFIGPVLPEAVVQPLQPQPLQPQPSPQPQPAAVQPHPALQPFAVLGSGPNPAAGIPVFARNRYRYYLRITQLLEFFTLGNGFTLGFEMWRFTAPNTWTNEGSFTALMTWKTAPTGYPSPGDYLEGDVKNSSGTVVGRLTMGWVSQYFRKATIEIDTVAGSEVPLNNGAGVTWNSIFDQVGWDINVQVSELNVAPPSGDSWSDAELHAAMLAHRAATNLDKEWRYHLLAVRLLDSTPRGIMYDAFGTDSNNVPREGLGISSHWVIPNSSPWGTVKGMRFGAAAAPYFRTAVHELGHAMGLYHNTVDNGFMNTTDVIASSCPATFPACIKWAFADDDLKRLRHYPDVYVRPGGTAFGTASTTTPAISPTDLTETAEGLELRVSPVMAALPLGAPVRVDLELRNAGNQPAVVPERLSLKGGFVRGTVTDPSGNSRIFSSIIGCLDEQPMRTLAPGESIGDSLTLLRGPDGALFPAPGPHRVTVEVRWNVQGIDRIVEGSADVIVTAAADRAHAEAALKVLSSPDALLTLALGGDHLTDGVEAIGAALANPVLRPHYAYIEAKRRAERFGQRGPDPGAGKLLEGCVMSDAEKRKAARLFKAAAAKMG